jgi:HEAT repeat protein
MGPAAATEAILARLAELLSDIDWRARAGAAQAVGGLGPAAATEPILAGIAELLRDTDRFVRSAAVKAFGGLGPRAATVTTLSRLVVLLSDKEEEVRFAAVGAVAGIGPAAATEPILTGIEVLLNGAKGRAVFPLLLPTVLVGALTLIVNQTLLKISLDETRGVVLALILVALAAWSIRGLSLHYERRTLQAVAPAVANLADSTVGLQPEQLRALGLRCETRLKALSATIRIFTATKTLELLQEMQGQEYRLFKRHWFSRCRVIGVRELSE